MSTGTRPTSPLVSTIAQAVQRDGIAGLPGVFPRSWAAKLHEDFVEAFADARRHPQGTVGRGPHRYYFAVHPERLRRFADLASRPVVTAVCGKCWTRTIRSSRLASTFRYRALPTSPGTVTSPPRRRRGATGGSPLWPSTSRPSTSLRRWRPSRSPPARTGTTATTSTTGCSPRPKQPRATDNWASGAIRAGATCRCAPG